MSRRIESGTFAAAAAICLLLAPAVFAGHGPGSRGSGPGVGPGHHGFGGPGGPGWGPGRGMLHELMIEHLDLTDAQLDEIGAAREVWGEQGAELHRELWDRRDALRQATEAGTFDEEAVRSAAAAVAEVEIELAVHRARVRSEILALLTEEQRAELRDMRQRMETRRERMRDRRRDLWSEGEE